MLPLSFPDRRFMQLCWVVPDLEEAILHWTRTTGVGPFLTVDRPQHDNPHYRGKPTECAPINVAMSQAGDVQIELVQPLDDRLSVFSELIPHGQGGFHHVAIYTADYDADVDFYVRGGAEIAYSGTMMGMRVCWIDTSKTLGFMVEVLEQSPVIDGIFEMIRNTAENWDGKDPIRPMG